MNRMFQRVTSKARVMPSITFQNVGFYYRDPYAEVFRDVSLRLDSAWKTGLIGGNGRGKTTFLNLLGQRLAPSAGHIKTALATHYFPYQPSDPSLSTRATVKDAVAPFRIWEKEMLAQLDSGSDADLARYGNLASRFEAQGGYQIDARIEKAFSELGLPSHALDRSFSTLSGGEQTRALITALFLRDDGIALIDEPTNHLDMEGRELLANYLWEQPGGYIVVSHDRYFLDACCDHMLSINKSGFELIHGNYSVWKQQTDTRGAFEHRRQENLKRDIKQLKRAASQRRAAGTKKEKEKKGAADKGFVGARAARHMKRALVLERRVQNNLREREGLLRNNEKERTLKLSTAKLGAKILLTNNNLDVDIEGTRIISELSLQVSAGDRLAVIGPNGCGKTTLLNVINADLPISRGTIKLPAHISTARAYQQPAWSTGNLRDKLLAEGYDETRFRRVLGEFGVEGGIFERPLETFSQGQLKKVDLCRTIASPCELLIWDEPMNYIDVSSREQIEAALLRSQPTLLFVEHDRYFVETVATKVINLG